MSSRLDPLALPMVSLLALAPACRPGGPPPTAAHAPTDQQPTVAPPAPTPIQPETASTPPGPGPLRHLTIDRAGGCVGVDDREILCWGLSFGLTSEPPSYEAERVAHHVELGQGDAKLLALELDNMHLCGAFDDGQRRCRRYSSHEGPGEPERQAIEVPLEITPGEAAQLSGRACARVGEFVSDYGTNEAEVRCAPSAAAILRKMTGDPGRAKFLDATAICVEQGSDEWTCVGPREHTVGWLLGHVEAGLRDADTWAGYTCALDDAGQVVCAGPNAYGRLGTGDTEHHMERVPVSLPGPAHEVATSSHMSCALVEQSVWCWGALGVGNFTPRKNPREITWLEIESKAVRVAEQLSCAVQPDDELLCWGLPWLGGDNNRHGGLVRAARPEPARAYQMPIDELENHGLISKGVYYYGSVLDRAVDPSKFEGIRESRGVRANVDGCEISTKKRLTCPTADHFRARSGVTEAVAKHSAVVALANGSVTIADRYFASKQDAGWTLVKGFNDVIDVAEADAGHFCFVTKAGTAHCFLSWADTYEAFELPITDAVELVGGGYGVCVRHANHALSCGWASPEATFDVVIEAGVVELAEAPDHWCARVDGDGDGTTEVIACGGDNREGQLGTVGGHVLLTPTAIELPTTIGD